MSLPPSLRSCAIFLALMVGTGYASCANAEREAPGKLEVASTVAGYVVVNWTHTDKAEQPDLAMEERPLGYGIHLATDSGWHVTQRVGPEVSTFTQPGLSASTTYAVKVCAIFDDAGEEDFCTPEQSVTTQRADAGTMTPATPFMVTSIDVGTTWIRFNWVGSQDRYIIAFSADGQAATERSAGLEDARQFTLTDLRPGTTYDITLKACSLELLMRRCLSEHKARPTTLGLGLQALPGTEANAIRVAWNALPEIDGLAFTLNGAAAQGASAPQAGTLKETSLPVPLANHAYTVCMCWQQGSFSGCEEVQARPRPTPPSAPTGLLVLMRGGGGVGIEVGKALERQPIAQFDAGGVAGETLVLEREYSGSRGRPSQQVMPRSWREAASAPWKAGRTALALPPPGTALTIGSGAPTGRVRACAVVASLGDAGRACSEPVAAP